jgi:hypothetical protein
MYTFNYQQKLFLFRYTPGLSFIFLRNFFLFQVVVLCW